MNIVFFGTSIFAKEILDKLYSYPHNILCVVTKEDAKKDRGQKLTPPPVKIYAQEKGLDISQVHTFKENEDFKNYFMSLNPDVAIVAAYGKILPDYILEYPKYGAINVHGSILPEYRGAAPIQRAIMDGKTDIGITIMQMSSGLDTGDMIAKDSIKICDDDNFLTIQSSLAKLGANLLLDVLENIETTKYPHTIQDDEKATYAKKIEEEDRYIDFSSSALVCFNKIRALYPDICAYAILNGQKIKITKAIYEPSQSNSEPGTIANLYGKGDGYIDVNTSSGILKILKLIPPGKGEMTAGDFIRGRKINIDDHFS